MKVFRTIRLPKRIYTYDFKSLTICAIFYQFNRYSALGSFIEIKFGFRKVHYTVTILRVPFFMNSWWYSQSRLTRYLDIPSSPKDYFSTLCASDNSIKFYDPLNIELSEVDCNYSTCSGQKQPYPLKEKNNKGFIALLSLTHLRYVGELRVHVFQLKEVCPSFIFSQMLIP